MFTFREVDKVRREILAGVNSKVCGSDRRGNLGSCVVIEFVYANTVILLDLVEQGLEGGGGGGGPDPAFPLFFFWKSCIPLSPFIAIPHPVPNFGESRFPGAVNFRIPHRFLVKSRIPWIPFQTLGTHLHALYVGEYSATLYLDLRE